MLIPLIPLIWVFHDLDLSPPLPNVHDRQVSKPDWATTTWTKGTAASQKTSVGWPVIQTVGPNKELVSCGYNPGGVNYQCLYHNSLLVTRHHLDHFN